MDSIALTDHGVLYGAIEFYTKAKERGINPIIGCEIYIAPRGMREKTAQRDREPFHLILLAKNNNGYKNLIKITSRAHLEGFYYKPRVDKQFLRQHSGDLVALTACLSGEVPRKILAGDLAGAQKAAQEYEEIFGKGNFFLELQHHPEWEDQQEANAGMIDISKKTGIPVVVTKDVHYINSDDAEAHDILLCVQTGKTIDDVDRLRLEGDLSLTPPEEMGKLYKDLPEAIENTTKIAKMCNVELKLGQNILPEFKVPGGMKPEEYLVKLCQEGIKKRYGKETKEIRDRLEYELSVISKTGFAPYFLIVSDFVKWAKGQGILVGPGRGSAAGSIVSYLLEITNVDPLYYNLVFERFLNPERIAMPDIDIDFADSRRDEVIKYVAAKYGNDHVAQIITFGTMAARNAIRDTARAMGISYGEADKIAKLIPFGATLEEAEKLKELKVEIEDDPRIKKLIEMAKKLEGVARHASTHAAGVVISRDALEEYVPLQMATKGEQAVITQYSMYDIEKIGLLKMDFLGLSNLTILEQALEIVEAVHGKNVKLEELPKEDKKTFELLAKGYTTGVFQLESDGMKKHLRDLKPSTFEDIVSMVALYRPGPMDAISDFIAGKHGRKSITYLHPSLKPILEKTYGIIVTQDQVLEIARKFAGLTYSEADILRKAVGKKIKKLLDEQKEKFVRGAISHSQVSKSLAEKVWNFIEPFARYGFNRAHAVCYAEIAYQTAYLKAHWPACFMAALMTSNKGDLDKIAKEVRECARMGIETLPPSVNESFRGFAVVPETGNIRFALGAIKNVGDGPIGYIVGERKAGGKYKSLEDFVLRVDFSVINKKTIESLAKSGALDDFGKREELLAGTDQILQVAASLKKKANSNQLDFFGQMEGDSKLPKIKLPRVSDFDEKIKLSFEKELLGLYISAHPLAPYRDFLENQVSKLTSIVAMREGQGIKSGGIITKIQKIQTKRGAAMIFATLEDLSGQSEVIVFPKILEQDPLVWQEDNVILVEGKISSGKNNEPKILADKAVLLTEDVVKNYAKTQNAPKVVSLKLPGSLNVEVMAKIQKLFSKNKGEVKIILDFGGKKVRVPFGVAWNGELREKLKNLLGNSKETASS